MVATILGGVGVFLLGMILMTDALKQSTGDALRRVLSRFVGGPFSALLTGAGATVLVQSSSATTLTTIGFVSAGLITFPQAVGVIFGANLGTTSTGWIVSLLGFELRFSALAMPLIGIGALMRMLLRGRWRHAGMALAGFGLMFVGIGVLQEGMSGLAERVDPASLPRDTLGGRLLLVLIGVVMTVLMQASGAAVATTLAALHSGAISPEQAAALVIGQNLGTVVRVILVSIGATVAVRRTAMAYILFNVFAGVITFVGMPALLWLSERAVGGAGEAAAIAAFHTLFNILGVALLMPWLGGFSRLVERLVPDRGPHLTYRLDQAVAQAGSVGVEAARLTVVDTTGVVLAVARRRLLGEPGGDDEDLGRAVEALGAVRRFLSSVSTPSDAGGDYRRHLATLHAIDHVDRMIDDCRMPVPAAVLSGSPELRSLAESVAAMQAQVIEWLGKRAAAPAEQVERTWQHVASERRRLRARVLEATALGHIDPDAANKTLDALHWVDRLGYHTWRTVYHLHTAPEAKTPIDDERA